MRIIAEKLDRINGTLEKMLEAMQKPEHPFLKALVTTGIVVGIFGIVQVIDTILKWF